MKIKANISHKEKKQMENIFKLRLEKMRKARAARLDE